MDRREMKTLREMNSDETDDATGLPRVLWAEEWGCALRSYACSECPTSIRHRDNVPPVAFEIMNDTDADVDVSPPLKKGEILFLQRSVQLCQKRIDFSGLD